jgi:hypothetical protein
LSQAQNDLTQIQQELAEELELMDSIR